MVRHLAGPTWPRSASVRGTFTQNPAGSGHPPVGLGPQRHKWPNARTLPSPGERAQVRASMRTAGRPPPFGRRPPGGALGLRLPVRRGLELEAWHQRFAAPLAPYPGEATGPAWRVRLIRACRRCGRATVEAEKSLSLGGRGNRENVVPPPADPAGQSRPRARPAAARSSPGGRPAVSGHAPDPLTRNGPPPRSRARSRPKAGQHGGRRPGAGSIRPHPCCPAPLPREAARTQVRRALYRTVLARIGPARRFRSGDARQAPRPWLQVSVVARLPRVGRSPEGRAPAR
jgi:hypothetical protein